MSDVPSSDERCPECGAAISDGRAGCQALLDSLNTRARTDMAYAPTLRLAFDTYCMQHPDTYCRSAKSYAAHLMGLCCGTDFAGNPAIYAVIHRWLNGPKALEKPPVLTDRGAMTVVDIASAPDAATYGQLVHQWAACVWASYHSQHQLAHDWIAAALPD
jgi:hypothetical protein